mgnify:CR=1 FL=1
MSKNVVPVSEYDYLEEDPEIRGQKHIGREEAKLDLRAIAAVEVTPDLEESVIATYIYKNGSPESSTLSQYNIRELLDPSINYLLDVKNSYVNPNKIHLSGSWANLYNKGFFQEWHDHREIDFVCVFFANSGENFSKLFFFDWNTGISTPVMPDPGTIMFFSSKRTHGVTLHNNEVQRRTLSCNFEITNHHCH